MNKKYSRLLATALIGSAITLTGCVSTSQPTAGKATDIATVNFNLPSQIKWQQSKNSQAKNGGIVAEWLPQGTKSNNTQVRAIYQRLVPAAASGALLAQVATPLKKSCSDITVSPIKPETKYPGAVAQRVVCSKLGKSPFGIVLDTVAMNDKNASHLLISEVKIPASTKVGGFKPKNAKEQQQLQNTSNLVNLMYSSIQTARACDAKKQCQ